MENKTNVDCQCHCIVWSFIDYITVKYITLVFPATSRPCTLIGSPSKYDHPPRVHVRGLWLNNQGSFGLLSRQKSQAPCMRTQSRVFLYSTFNLKVKEFLTAGMRAKTRVLNRFVWQQEIPLYKCDSWTCVSVGYIWSYFVEFVGGIFHKNVSWAVL